MVPPASIHRDSLKKIAIVDIDVHNGDGTAGCVKNRESAHLPRTTVYGACVDGTLKKCEHESIGFAAAHESCLYLPGFASFRLGKMTKSHDGSRCARARRFRSSHDLTPALSLDSAATHSNSHHRANEQGDAPKLQALARRG